jgi:hypothetical protein
MRGAVVDEDGDRQEDQAEGARGGEVDEGSDHGAPFSGHINTITPVHDWHRQLPHDT